MKIASCHIASILAASCLLTACTAMSPAGNPPDLNSTAWVLSSLPGHTLRPHTAATARFEDGRVQGTDGCNNYTARYTHAGQKLTIGQAAATRRMCVKPERVMEQEQQFLKALEVVATVRFEGDRLELRTATGALAAALTK